MEKYVIKLYVTGRTPRARQAIRNLELICQKELGGRYELVEAGARARDVGRGLDRQTFAGDEGAQRRERVLVVVDDEHRGTFRRIDRVARCCRRRGGIRRNGWLRSC